MSDDRLSEEQVWTLYSDRHPGIAGPYRWQVPSKVAKGLLIEFVQHMRRRGAGGVEVLSPAFDYWDGGRVLVPEGTKWMPTEVTCKWHESVGLRLPSVELLPCPFCKVVPFWKGCQTGSDGRGVVMASDPHYYNSWWLECCSWARTPHMRDPRELAQQRNNLILGRSALS